MEYWVIKGKFKCNGKCNGRIMYFDCDSHFWHGESDKDDGLKIKLATWFKTKQEALNVIKEFHFGESIQNIQAVQISIKEIK